MVVAGNLEAGEGRVAGADRQAAVAGQPSRSGIGASCLLQAHRLDACVLRLHAANTRQRAEERKVFTEPLSARRRGRYVAGDLT